MPSLEEATNPINRAGLTPVNGPSATPVAVYPGLQYPAAPNTFLRCPLPPIFASPDSLRQFYQGGLIPQARVVTPPTLSQGQGSGGGTVNVISSTTNITNKSTPSKVGTVQNASITTPALNQLQPYTATLGVSTTFLPLTVSVSAAARVELYATAASQISDLLRPASVSPGAGTEQGILLDVTIDSMPFTWIVTPTLPSANADSPQKPIAYVTVTNLAAASVAITAAITYLILQP